MRITEERVRDFCEELVRLGYAEKTGKIWDGQKVDDVYHFTREKIQKYAKEHTQEDELKLALRRCKREIQKT